MRLKCQCCGFEEEFSNPAVAFDRGWDAPPNFTAHVCCPLCPAVCVTLGLSHKKAHELWAKEGRPAEWTVAKCGTDKDFGNTELDGFLNKVMKKSPDEMLRDLLEDVAKAQKIGG